MTLPLLPLWSKKQKQHYNEIFYARPSGLGVCSFWHLSVNTGLPDKLAARNLNGKNYSQGQRKIKRYAKLASQKKARDEQGLFVIEGIKLFEEAVRSNVEMEQIFLSEAFCPDGNVYKNRALCRPPF